MVDTVFGSRAVGRHFEVALGKVLGLVDTTEAAYPDAGKSDHIRVAHVVNVWRDPTA